MDRWEVTVDDLVLIEVTDLKYSICDILEMRCEKDRCGERRLAVWSAPLREVK